MNPAIAALERVDTEVSRLLVAGLGTRRAGRERLETLADEVARLKLERLATELRALASVEDPAKAAGSAVNCLTLARKLRERLDPWPEVDVSNATPLESDPRVRLVGHPHPSPLPEGEGVPPLPSGGTRPPPTDALAGPLSSPLPFREEPVLNPSRSLPSSEAKGSRVDSVKEGQGVRSVSRPQSVESVAESVDSLADRLLTGHSLVRADAARRLVALGDAGVDALAGLAAKGTVTVRREAIAALGRIGTESALRALVAHLGDESARRELRAAVLPFGEAAVPHVLSVLGRDSKKGKDAARRGAAWILFCLRADGQLREFGSDSDQVVAGFGLAARARSAAAWSRLGAEVADGKDYGDLTRDVFAVAAAEASVEIGTLVEALDSRGANRAEAAAAYLAGGQLEMPLAEHYLVQLVRGTAKDRKRAESVLKGLAVPALVPRIIAAHDRGEIAGDSVSPILAETGGDQAVGCLVDLARAPETAPTAAQALGLLGDPSAASTLLSLVAEGSKALIQAEFALVGLGDSAVDYLAQEMRSANGARGLVAKRVLLQIRDQGKSRRAARALEGVDVGSVDLLLSYLGHPNLGKTATKDLAKRGEPVLDALVGVVRGGSPSARLDALATIAAIRTPRAASVVHDVVEEMLAGGRRGSDAVVAAKGIELLPGLRNERTIPLAARAMAVAPQFYNVGEAASKALVKLGREAVPHILPYLSHSHGFVRMLALRTLGELAAPEAEEKAIELLSDKDYSVVNAAVVALGQIGRATGSLRIVQALGAAAVSPGNLWPVLAVNALAATGQAAAIRYLREASRVWRAKYQGSSTYLDKSVDDAIREIEKAAKTPPEQPTEARPESGGLLGQVRRLFGGK